MIDPSEMKSLDQVLFEFITENEAPSRDALNEWIRRYPQYERELTDLAVDWFELSLPLPADAPIADEADVTQRGVDYVRGYLADEAAHPQPSPQTPKPFLGFVGEARALHLTLDAFAEQIGLTPALLAKIDQRMVKYASLPVELLQSLSDAVGRDPFTGTRYLQAQPVIPGNQRFKSTQPPQASEHTDFFDEVRADPDLSEEQRQHWLALEPKR